MSTHKVTFLPDKQTSVFQTGTTLREAALDLGILIDSDCAGIGTCGQCKVVATGAVGPVTDVEKEILSPEELASNTRLSCQATIQGACLCTIGVTPRIAEQQIMSEGKCLHFPFSPDTRQVVLRVTPPEVGDKHFDLEAVEKEIRLHEPDLVQPSLVVIKALPGLTRESEGRLTAILDRNVLLRLEKGNSPGPVYGVAFDIGTTTVVGKLIDLVEDRTLAVVSALNAQEPFGADVVTRAKYTIENPGGLERLHRLIIDQLSSMIEDLCEEAGIDPSDVWKCVIVGNTVMQHLALGVDPHYVVVSPFTPALQGPVTVSAGELGLRMASRGAIYVLPNLACFVGGDMTAVLVTLDLETSDELHLVVDIGTNGEIVLGSRQRIVCCSSPAGPAWEGASITWGMRAAYGAIERIDLQGNDLAYRTIGNGPPAGICGSGLMDLAALSRRTGIVDESGRMLADDKAVHAPEPLKARLGSRESGAFLRIAPARDDSWVELTQKDVREIQLAKAAIASGIQTLLCEWDVGPEQIDRVSIAGAFGNHIRGQDAIDIGLLPRVPAERIHFIGNAAAAGAEAILRSREARAKAERLAQTVDYVEVAGRPEFQDLFVDCLLFP